MLQPIIAGYNDNLNPAATEYNGISGGFQWDPLEWRFRQLISTPGSLSQLRVELTAPPGAGASYTFTLMLNGVATALSVTIAGGVTAGSDLVNVINVIAGNRVSIRCVPAGAPAVALARFSLLFNGTNPNQSLILGESNSLPPNIVYAPVSQSSGQSLPGDVKQIAPTLGIISSLYVNLHTRPFGGGYRYTLRKNGVPTGLSVTIMDPATTGGSLGAVVVAPWDQLDIMIEPLLAVWQTLVSGFGLAFVASTDGESLILGGSLHSPGAVGSTYNQLLVGFLSGTWLGADDNKQLTQACNIKNLYVQLWAPPGIGKSRIFTVLKNGVSTSLSCQISDLNTEGSDLIHSIAFAAGDKVSIMETVTGAPVPAASARWSAVCYTGGILLPTVTTNPASGIGATQATLNGLLNIDGGEPCSLSFQWGDTPTLANTVSAGTGVSGTAFSATLPGLLPNHLYYFRAVATNAKGTSYGSVLTFIMSSGTPESCTVATLAAVEITEGGAMLRGVVQESFGRYGAVRFEWGRDTTYGNFTPWHEGFHTGDLFQERLYNLTPGAAYHFRAQFMGSGIVSGSDQAFNTLAELGPVTFVDEETILGLEERGL
jgi:hypothetical protein